MGYPLLKCNWNFHNLACYCDLNYGWMIWPNNLPAHRCHLRWLRTLLNCRKAVLNLINIDLITILRLYLLSTSFRDHLTLSMVTQMCNLICHSTYGWLCIRYGDYLIRDWLWTAWYIEYNKKTPLIYHRLYYDTVKPG